MSGRWYPAITPDPHWRAYSGAAKKLLGEPVVNADRGRLALVYLAALKILSREEQRERVPGHIRNLRNDRRKAHEVLVRFRTMVRA